MGVYGKKTYTGIPKVKIMFSVIEKLLIKDSQKTVSMEKGTIAELVLYYLKYLFPNCWH
jgi:hypothetical protein